jgi:hypothetical protein
VEPAIPADLPPLPALTTNGKPDKVQVLAILTLISGISNIIWPLVLYSIIGASTVFIGCLFLPLYIPPIVLGIYEIIYAAKLLPNPAKPVKPSSTIAMLEIVSSLTGNLVSVAAGITALVMYNESDVKDFFSRLNA